MRRSELTPMFFIARMTAAMLIGFWGSYSTTCTWARTESAIGNTKIEKVVGSQAVAAEVDEFASASAHHELTAPALAIGRHLVDHDAKLEGIRDVGSERGEIDGDSNGVTVRGALPRRIEGRGIATNRARADANTISIELRNQQPIELPRGRALEATRNYHMQLNSVAVRVGKLVIERVRVDPRREVHVPLFDVDDHEKLVPIGPQRDRRARCSGVGPRILGTAVVRLGQVKHQSAERAGRRVRPRDHQWCTSGFGVRGDGRGAFARAAEIQGLLAIGSDDRDAPAPVATQVIVTAPVAQMDGDATFLARDRLDGTMQVPQTQNFSTRTTGAHEVEAPRPRS